MTGPESRAPEDEHRRTGAVASDLPWLGPDPAEHDEETGRRPPVGRRREDHGPIGPGWFATRERTRSPVAARRRTISVRLLATADVLAAACGLGLLAAVSGQALHPWAALVLPGIVLIAKVTGLYDRDDVVIERSTLEEAPALFQMATLTALVAWLGQSLIAQYALRPLHVMAAWLGLFLMLVAARWIARWLTRELAPAERLLFIGEEPAYRRLEAKVAGKDRAGAGFAGWVPLHGPAVHGALGGLADLPEIVRAHDVHRVVISASHGSEEMLEVVRLMKLLDVRVSLLPRMLEVVGTALEFEDLHGLPLMGVRPFGLSRSSEFVKRALDMATAGVGLVCVAPLFAVAAALIKLDSPGPIFFRQARVGRGGVAFDMLKFRSMVRDADERKAELQHLNEADGLFKIAADPRVTRVGRWLRRTSLDELPQLLNVLRGDMSLVGPRPLVPDDDDRVQGWHRQRLQLTPGMTGPWQVLGSARIPLHEMVTLDYLYVANWSLWNDIKILLRTVPVVLGGRGL
jgi:exopolysaccharide biosynthesis polyprenyl glycosylphosphotransferase